MRPSAGYSAAVCRIARPGSSAPITGLSRVPFLVVVDSVRASVLLAGRSWAGGGTSSHDSIWYPVRLDTMPTAIIGSVTAAPGMLFSYDLSYAKDSDGVYVSISSGTEPYAGFLGVLDPTLLENGIQVRALRSATSRTFTTIGPGQVAVHACDRRPGELPVPGSAGGASRGTAASSAGAARPIRRSSPAVLPGPGRAEHFGWLGSCSMAAG